MDTPSPGTARGALRLAERLIQLLDRGGFTSTYKYAVLIGLIDLCMEHTSANEGNPPDFVTTRHLAEKVIELYWPHSAPYEDRGVLRQNVSKRVTREGKVDTQAEIIRYIRRFREDVPANPAASLSLVRARALAAHGEYGRLVRIVEWKLIEWPLPRLQIIGREVDRFLYDYGFSKETGKKEVDHYQQGLSAKGGGFDNRLRLQAGVGAGLIALNGVLRPLILRSWALMVGSLNGIEEPPLEEFLFGAPRIALDPVRPGLLDVQQGRCFYCRKGLSGPSHVDHFVPWARHPDNSIDNLVVAHKECNGSKSDFLAAAEHVEKWRERSIVHAADLAQIAAAETWESRPARTFSVARAIYGALPEDARLWVKGESFIRIEPERIAVALAA